MIIDCHGTHATAPKSHREYRVAQLAAHEAGEPLPSPLAVSDDEIRESIERNQLKLLRERGVDMTIFSPQASAVAHRVHAVPAAGHYFDDTKRYVDALDLNEADRHKVFEGNARRVYPRPDAALKARGK